MRNLLIAYLSLLSKLQLLKIRPKVVALTGSVGKTSLKSILVSILAQKYRVKSGKKSLNSEFGIPMAVFGIEASANLIKYILSLALVPPLKLLFDWTKYDIFVLEVGVDKPGDIKYLKRVTKVNVAILLNIFPVHTLNFPTNDPLKEIFTEKNKIFESLKSMGTGFLNTGNEFIQRYLPQVTKDSRVKTFSTQPNTDFSYSYRMLEGSQIEVTAQNCTCKTSVPLFEEYSSSLAVSMLVGKHFGLSCEEIQAGLSNFGLEPGRFSFFEGVNGSTILDSSYNSSPAALAAVLAFVKKQNYQRKILCLGEMRELGDLSKEEHQKLVPMIENSGDYAFLVGEDIANFVYKDLKLPEESKKMFANSKDLGNFLSTFIQPGDLVLFKGSQNTIFLEEAIKEVLKNKSDEQKLCRQDAFWIQKKQAYFAKRP